MRKKRLWRLRRLRRLMVFMVINTIHYFLCALFTFIGTSHRTCDGKSRKTSTIAYLAHQAAWPSPRILRGIWPLAGRWYNPPNRNGRLGFSEGCTRLGFP